ncbi:MAG TPA: diguanylate cyclase [Terracidiphilus sp.]|nr:diguanylate cyclase [Terracidiphilus sp.]
MLTNTPPIFLLGSPEPELLTAIEPVLTASGPRVEVVLSAEAALEAMTGASRPALALLDVKLPGMEMGQLLAAARAAAGDDFPIVLIADAVTQEWIDRMAEGVVDDMVLRTSDAQYWQLRIGMALHTHRLAHEVESLREAAAMHAQLDRLTGVYNRETLMAMLFRETDRVQRMNGGLCLVLFDIDDFGHWNSRLGTRACDELLCQVVGRSMRLLRSYDLLGRPGNDEFLLALPGCGVANAVLLAERLRSEVFSAPFRVGGEAIRLSACFGIASSGGRSPVVVLREAEQALHWAQEIGPESIQCFGEREQPEASPVTFLSASSGDELLAW